MMTQTAEIDLFMSIYHDLSLHYDLSKNHDLSINHDFLCTKGSYENVKRKVEGTALMYGLSCPCGPDSGGFLPPFYSITNTSSAISGLISMFWISVTIPNGIPPPDKVICMGT